PGGPADWHTTLSNTRARLHEWAARTGCKPGVHREDPPNPWSHGADHDYVEALRAFVTADHRRREATEYRVPDQIGD
ncbi:MAG: hypothetical protein ABIV05_04270, partial [Actinomycetota bacterium]